MACFDVLLALQRNQSPFPPKSNSTVKLSDPFSSGRDAFWPIRSQSSFPHC
jgi:hypothetical protein